MAVELADVAGLSAWIYLVIIGLAAADAVLPLLPSESIVILAAVLAGQGQLNPWIIAVCAAVGAAMGDSTSFLIGRGARRGREPRLDGRFGGALKWARNILCRRGPSVLVVARFVPGGRTAATFASGYLGIPAGSFLAAIAIGAVLWAAHGTILGYIGGRVFHDNVWLGMGLGLALGLVAALAIELIHALVTRRSDRYSSP